MHRAAELGSRTTWSPAPMLQLCPSGAEQASTTDALDLAAMRLSSLLLLTLRHSASSDLRSSADSTPGPTLATPPTTTPPKISLGPVSLVGNGSATTSEFGWNGTHAVRGPPVRLGHAWFCSGYMVPLGAARPPALYLQADTALDAPWQPQVNGAGYLSRDGGRSWRELGHVPNVMNTAVLAPDGSALGIPMHIQPLGFPADESSTWAPPCDPQHTSAESAGCRRWGAIGSRLTLGGAGVVSEPVDIGFTFAAPLGSVVVIGNVLPLDNQTLFTTLYGGFVGSPTTCQRCPKPDIIAMTSTDGGLHWSQLSILAHWNDPTPAS
eukprot:COSAG04_NODE_2663_length_3766_cov_2.381238_1_plen_322_part_10